MNNNTLQVKFKQRLNKIDSQDYDNIQAWEISEAFNKAQIEWCRRQLAGTNMRQEGDEMSKRRIDDLEILLTSKPLLGFDVAYNNTFGYFEAQNFNTIYDPALGGDYLEFKKIECKSQACFAYTPASSVLVNPAIPPTEAVYTDGGFEEVIITPAIDPIDPIPGQDEIVEWIQTPTTVPIFEFISNGYPTTAMSNVDVVLNQIATQTGYNLTWNQYYAFAYNTDGIATPPQFQSPYEAMTNDGLLIQEPWLWNLYSELYNDYFDYQVSDEALLVDAQNWEYGENFTITMGDLDGQAGNNLDVPDMPNPDIILPIGAGGGLQFALEGSDYATDCLVLATMCGSSAQELIDNASVMVTNAINNSNSGYIVGGPNNEYMWIEDGVIQFGSQTSYVNSDGLPIGNYSYTGSPNNYSPALGWSNLWGGISTNTWDASNIGTTNYTAQCVTSGGCWYSANHVYMTTFDSTGEWIVTQEAIEEVPGVPGVPAVTELQELPDILVTPGTPGSPAEYEETAEVACFCAPGADKENFCTKARTMTVYLSEVANTDVVLRDPLKNPNFEWCETFCTFQSRAGNVPSLRIWRRNFFIMEPVLHYYRTPRRIEIAGSVDPYTGLAVAADVIPEFKDDIVEVMIDNAVSILAGDISDSNQMMRGEQSAEKNN
jgi:hypothetical protein